MLNELSIIKCSISLRFLVLVHNKAVSKDDDQQNITESILFWHNYLLLNCCQLSYNRFLEFLYYPLNPIIIQNIQ